jgi:hypothetical protein
MAGIVFHTVKEYRFRIHWPPDIRFLAFGTTAGRLFRWIRLLVYLNKAERTVCDAWGVSRKDYAAAFKNEGIRRYH